MNIPIIRKQGGEVFQDARYVRRFDVMKKAVYEYEVVLRTLWSDVTGRVGDEKVAVIAAAREVNVSRIDVDA